MMTTIHCATELLKGGDFNARVTVFDLNPELYTKGDYKGFWISAIFNSLGEDVDYSSIVDFTVKVLGSEQTSRFKGLFYLFIASLKIRFPKPVSLRITSAEKSWLIILAKDL